MPDDSALPPEVLEWLEQVDARWRACGLDMTTRSALGAELAEDVRAALAGGAQASDLVAERPETFADQLASAAGAHPARPVASVDATMKAVVVTGMFGAVIGGFLTWVFVLPGMVELAYSDTHFAASAALIYLVCGLVVVASCLGAIGFRFRDDPRTRRVVKFIAPAIIGFGLLSIGPAVGLAWLLNYSTSAAGVVLVGGVVLAFVATGIYVGQRLASRTGQGASSSA